jgi:hypothetical protein
MDKVSKVMRALRKQEGEEIKHVIKAKLARKETIVSGIATGYEGTIPTVESKVFRKGFIVLTDQRLVFMRKRGIPFFRRYKAEIELPLQNIMTLDIRGHLWWKHAYVNDYEFKIGSGWTCERFIHTLERLRNQLG